MFASELPPNVQEEDLRGVFKDVSWFRVSVEGVVRGDADKRLTVWTYSRDQDYASGEGGGGDGGVYAEGMDRLSVLFKCGADQLIGQCTASPHKGQEAHPGRRDRRPSRMEIDFVCYKLSGEDGRCSHP